MKTKILGMAILVWCAAILMVALPGCGMADTGTRTLDQNETTNTQPEQITSSLVGSFILADLQGKWTIQMRGNENVNYEWNYMKVDIDEFGVMNCLEYYDSVGGVSCVHDAPPPMPTLSITPDGIINFGSHPIVGNMDVDRNAAYLLAVNGDGITTHTGAMVKVDDNLVTSDMAGQWNIQLRGNNRYDFSLGFMKVDINEFGEATCLSYRDTAGNISCSDVPGMLTFTVNPYNGFMDFGNLSFIGFLDPDKNAAYFFRIDSEGVTHTGVMSRAANDFVSTDLIGQWNLQLRSNANYGYEWSFMKMDVDENGMVTCIEYYDGNVNGDCSGVPGLPAVSIYSNGLVKFENIPVLGVMDVDRNAAYLFRTDADGITHTGVMSKTW